MLGAIVVAGLAPSGVLFGFGAFLIASGLFYALPIAVQPMKAVSAIMLTEGLGPEDVAATGILLGSILLVLGASGAMRFLARAIPQSVTTGLQLGLGVSMVLMGLHIAHDSPWLGALAFLGIVLLLRIPGCPAALVVLIAAILLGSVAGTNPSLPVLRPGFHLPPVILPDAEALWRGLQQAVLPQLALTLTNAVIVTAIVIRDLFPERSGRAGVRSLALTTGLGNLILAPFGAFPMCHGAGGVQAQARFGARTGMAPILLGLALLVLGLMFAPAAAGLLGAVPLAAVGALLAFAGFDLAWSRRLFDARPECWAVIGVTAAVALLVNPAAGLGAGWVLELLQRPLARMLGRLRRR